MATVDLLTSVYSSHAVYLERVAAKFGNDVIPFLESIEKRISKTLNAMPSKALTPQETSLIRAEIDKITREELQAYTTQYKIDNKEVGQHQVAFDAKTLESVTAGYEASIPSAGIVNKVAITTPIQVGENQFNTYNRYVANYWQQYTKVINDSVSAGFINGGTNREITANILASITLDNDDGDLSKAKRAAKTMARTGTNHYATQSTIAFVDKNEEVLIGYRFLATLDGRTSRQCSANDQEVFKTGSPMPTPPLHPNCRSRLIYEVDGRHTYDDSASTRPSNFRDADGERDPKRVSSKKTYYEELKKMNAADRNAILGPQLGPALSKMDAETFAKSLIDSTFEPLSIAEMKKKSNELGRILQGKKVTSKKLGEGKFNPIIKETKKGFTIETDGGMLEGDIIGKDFMVKMSFVDEGSRGRGEGMVLYLNAIAHAKESGLTRVISDNGIVEAPAVRMYAALEKRGFDVTKHKDFKLVKDPNGDFAHADGSSSFSIKL